MKSNKPRPQKPKSCMGVRDGALHPNAAGIDLGAREHYVALPQDRGQPVRVFGCFTPDLQEMARWLLKNRIDTVAMEATGVYWIPVFQILEDAGLDVQLVNASRYRNVPERKTDVSDSQWLQTLHECGLVRGSFRPNAEICALRAIQRQKENWVEEASRHTLRMQKALEQCNVQLHKIIRSVVSLTGLSIIRAVVAGEEDPEVLAKLRNTRCKREEADFIKALTGDWRPEHVFCLAQELAAYDATQQRIEACDARLLEGLQKLEAKAEVPAPAKSCRGRAKVDPVLHCILYRATGVDLLAAEGIGPELAVRLVTEVGTDMSLWPTEAHFCSWARLAPRNNITGGQRRRAGTTKPSRVAQCFRIAAQPLARADSALGAYYRSVRTRRGPLLANAATAHKLARIFYRIMKYGEAYVRQERDAYEAQHRERAKRSSIKRLKGLGFEVTCEDTRAGAFAA